LEGNQRPYSSFFHPDFDLPGQMPDYFSFSHQRVQGNRTDRLLFVQQKDILSFNYTGPVQYLTGLNLFGSSNIYLIYLEKRTVQKKV
jgi:hypothetical protein